MILKSENAGRYFLANSPLSRSVRSPDQFFIRDFVGLTTRRRIEAEPISTSQHKEMSNCDERRSKRVAKEKIFVHVRTVLATNKASRRGVYSASSRRFASSASPVLRLTHLPNPVSSHD